MPNTPALVQAGASVLAPGSSALPGDKEIVAELLSCIGICETSTEELLDAVTGLSGSGPAYVSLIGWSVLLIHFDWLIVASPIHVSF